MYWESAGLTLYSTGRKYLKICFVPFCVMIGRICTGLKQNLYRFTGKKALFVLYLSDAA